MKPVHRPKLWLNDRNYSQENVVAIYLYKKHQVCIIAEEEEEEEEEEEGMIF